MHTSDQKHSDRLAPVLPARPVTVPLFAFDYKRTYGGLYTNRHERLVLREEHVAELRRVVNDYNRARALYMPALSMSEVVNAMLDFGFEHPVALVRIGKPENYRDALAREVYRKAFFHFTLNGLL